MSSQCRCGIPFTVRSRRRRSNAVLGSELYAAEISRDFYRSCTSVARKASVRVVAYDSFTVAQQWNNVCGVTRNTELQKKKKTVRRALSGRDGPQIASRDDHKDSDRMFN